MRCRPRPLRHWTSCSRGSDTGLSPLPIIILATRSQGTTMLKGKTALVTGSTSGIGLGIAVELARDGANVMLNGFGDIERAKRAVAECSVKVSYHGADISKPAEIAQMIHACEEEFGALDVLVNNAGIQHVAKVEDFPPERWDAIVAI